MPLGRLLEILEATRAGGYAPHACPMRGPCVRNHRTFHLPRRVAGSTPPFADLRGVRLADGERERSPAPKDSRLKSAGAVKDLIVAKVLQQ